MGGGGRRVPLLLNIKLYNTNNSDYSFSPLLMVRVFSFDLKVVVIVVAILCCILAAYVVFFLLLKHPICVTFAQKRVKHRILINQLLTKYQISHI